MALNPLWMNELNELINTEKSVNGALGVAQYGQIEQVQFVPNPLERMLMTSSLQGWDTH